MAINTKKTEKRPLAQACRFALADRQQHEITQIDIENEAERSGLSWHAIPTAYPWPGLAKSAAPAEKARPKRPGEGNARPTLKSYGEAR
jgi:hypothetical protein